MSVFLPYRMVEKIDTAARVAFKIGKLSKAGVVGMDLRVRRRAGTGAAMGGDVRENQQAFLEWLAERRDLARGLVQMIEADLRHHDGGTDHVAEALLAFRASGHSAFSV
jgi:hypothetical protein